MVEHILDRLERRGHVGRAGRIHERCGGLRYASAARDAASTLVCEKKMGEIASEEFIPPPISGAISRDIPSQPAPPYP